MTHIAAPSGINRDSQTGVSCTWPDLTDTQRQVIDLLGFDPGHGVCVRLTVAEMATVDEVVRWAENRLSCAVRPANAPDTRIDVAPGNDAAQVATAGLWAS